MGLIHQIEVHPLESIATGMTTFYTPQPSHETMLVQVDAGVAEDLFVHHFQTDQLVVVRGAFVLVILQNRSYRYLYLSDRNPQVVTIPPGVPHGAVNLSNAPCSLINAVIRHGPPYAKDYRPVKLPFPYDLVGVRALMEKAAVEVPMAA
jgi:mannose-6-phosphate isomerase-like protein (cupin superfamily)